MPEHCTYVLDIYVKWWPTAWLIYTHVLNGKGSVVEESESSRCRKMPLILQSVQGHHGYKVSVYFDQEQQPCWKLLLSKQLPLSEK